MPLAKVAQVSDACQFPEQGSALAGLLLLRRADALIILQIDDALCHRHDLGDGRIVGGADLHGIGASHRRRFRRRIVKPFTRNQRRGRIEIIGEPEIRCRPDAQPAFGRQCG